MNLSAPFVQRPVGTTLLTLAVALAGALAFRLLPVSPLPQVEFPTLLVTANLPGASPETMAATVATPLERQFGRIAGITEMSSTSALGSTSVVLQFDLDRDIDAAARDVQAAINAARSQLPANLPSNPAYRKINPADAPILILSLTSQTHDRGRLYDVASSVLQQKLARLEGVGQVMVGGGALPAIRVAVNPTLLNNYGLGLAEVRAALAAANVNRPKGELADAHRSLSLVTSDQLFRAEDYRSLIVAYRDSGAVQLGDIATVTDSIEDLRTGGLVHGKPAVLVIVYRQPGANIIETVDRVRAALPALRAALSPAIDLEVVMDRTGTIRASVRDVEFTLVLSTLLVIGVVFLFLGSGRAALIPTVAIPVSLIGTFGAMYLFGYSLNNLSLMALTIATGFVVDDAIVVIENISRHLERGRRALDAALRGAQEIGFTVLSMSLSLVAVFIPILLMGGIVGRLFHEFAVTLSIAILLSLVVSLTTTPMLCAALLRPPAASRGPFRRRFEAAFARLLRSYQGSLRWVLGHRRLTLLVTLATMALTVHLYAALPKGFFPQQDTGRLAGQILGDQSISFQAMFDRLRQFVRVVEDDPAVENALAFTGGGGGAVNTGRMFVTLKPIEERRESADAVIARLRAKTAAIPGASLYLQSVQDLRIGGRASAAQFQFTLQGDNLEELAQWTPRVLKKLRTLPQLADVNSDQQNKGLAATLAIDRETAARLGVSVQAIDETLYDAFGQRQVSTLYTALNQYHVVMEVAPEFRRGPQDLNQLYVRSAAGRQVPLGAVARYQPSATALAVTHAGQFPAVTLSFNLAPGHSLGEAVAAITEAARELRLPASIQARFQGAAQAFQASLADQPILIGAALLVVYIVLGILYESYVHPLTILSTLPSAGLGALLALLLQGTELNVMALIGILLLIGIVKKNAILMIDFALEAERHQGKSPEEAIFQACLLRFRPILMTTLAALLGALPLAIGFGTGAELRQPLGVAVVGGLLLSQVLTLYTTPVVYLYLDRLRCLGLRLPGIGRSAP
ncbi:multidrug efflux RND transporter permease subunit [Candidatus Methylocalor cossyra]|uniref:Multidrug efflux pump RND permease subunit MdtC n=1 Tax=Candidatus Methylocalor cossyra TaxID=3108543 RepID=A0ABM9NLI3_9GAMM